MLPSSLTIALDRSAGRTLSVQIADAVRGDIDSGRIAAGTRLPSSRALSADLKVARGVVEVAYDQLIAEGWLETHAGSGTFVRRIRTHTSTPALATTRGTTAPPEQRIRLATGTPWIPPRTSAAWKRAWRDVGLDLLPQPYPDPRGDPELRAAIAQLLGRARGLHTSADSIVVTTGSMHGMSLALAALGDLEHPGTPVLAHENPGYRVATTAARRWGWSLHDVPVDADGLRTDDLDHAPQSTRAIYTTPSHQYPTGGLLTVGRRRALADFARGRGAMIIEDDYDSEFRYDVAPLPTVAELAPDRTIYLGTVAKTLGAGVRLGWLVAPPEFVERITEVRADLGDYPSIPIQRAMISLLRDGEWDRTVRAARRLYRGRDREVSTALAPFGELRGVGAGMYTTLLLDSATADRVARTAAAAGVDVDTLARSTRSSTPMAGILVGYGAVSDEELAYGLEVLTTALRGVS